MSEIILKNITKRWGDFVGVADMNLTIPDKEFLVLVELKCALATSMTSYSSRVSATEVRCGFFELVLIGLILV